MGKKLFENDLIKPFWKTWWFWLLVALIVMQLPIFGEKSQVPDGFNERFYNEAKDSYNELIDKWIERKAPSEYTTEWIKYHYGVIDSPEENFSDEEIIVIDALHTMLEQLLLLDEAINRGSTHEHETFVAAGKVAREFLQLEDEE